MKTTLLTLAALGALALPTFAQSNRQVVQSGDHLVEVVHGSQWVRLRIYDWDGVLLDMRRVTGRLTIRADRSGGFASRQARLRFWRGDANHAPYLEAGHGLGSFQRCETLKVSGTLRNVPKARGRTLNIAAVWVDGLPASAGVSCGVPDACRFCSKRLCRFRPRQVVTSRTCLVEVFYGPKWVKLRVYDASTSRPLSLHGAVARLTLTAKDAKGTRRRVVRPVVVKRTAADPGYLRADHQLGRLVDTDLLQVEGTIAGVRGRGRIQVDVAWRGGSPTARRIPCRGRRCPLCARRLCR